MGGYVFMVERGCSIPLLWSPDGLSASWVLIIFIPVAVVLHVRLEFPFAFFDPHLHPECSSLERSHRCGPHSSQIFSLLTFAQDISFDIYVITTALKPFIATTFPSPLSLEPRLGSNPMISPSYRRVHPFFVSQFNGKCKAAVFR